MDLPDGILATPADDYELLDFGAGRLLERLGTRTVDRPHPAAAGCAPARPPWRADWTFTAGGEWRPRADAGREWGVRIAGRALRCTLGAAGDIGLRPDQAACWRWLEDRLRAAPGAAPAVLNLFAGPGTGTALAASLGARVVHVATDAEQLERARRSAGEAAERVTWVLEDIPTFVQRAGHRRERYDLILADPPGFQRGPGAHIWDPQRDLPRLFPRLAALLNPDALGLWVSFRSRDWSPESLAQLLRQVFPGRALRMHALGLATADGRILETAAAMHWAREAPAAQQRRLEAEAVEERLDAHLDPVLSSRRTAAEPARAIAGLERPQQEFALRWTGIIAHTNAELAFRFASRVSAALARMSEADVEAWLLQAVDAYDTAGLHAGLAALDAVEAFSERRAQRAHGVALEEVAGVLEAFVHGLAGRPLRLAAGTPARTDTETLFLPPLLARFAQREDNFRLYKAMAAHQWAQTWYGTWRIDVADAIARHPDPARALRVFHALETLRLDACIERDLPGLHRDMQALRAATGSATPPAPWQAAAARLRAPGAGPDDSLALLGGLYDAPLPEPAGYEGELDPQAVAAVRAARLERDRDGLRIALARLAEEQRRRSEAAGAGAEPAPPPSFRAVREVDPATPDGFTVRLELDGRPVAPPDDVKGTMASIIQDLGDVPDDWLVPAGDGAYARRGAPDEARDPRDVWKGMYHEEGAWLYNEWDYERRHYRKNWAVLREIDVRPGEDDFVARTLSRHRGLILQLRRIFEVLRGEDRLLKRQPYGDDVDIDALVEAYADARTGREMSDRLFTKMHKLERNIAVMFMVDMSGSTKGWINDAERESLILLCETLETLGDRYAIYGFSGMTRKRCELYRVKRFDEPYGEEVRRRISGIRPQDYTRMGVVIRHLSGLLQAVDARTRLLITLSDGKPDDLDGYRGDYGIEDTRMALIEAKRIGIHPYCITIDTEAREYLPHMYGAVNYTVIDEVRKLPLKVSEIYRKLTT